MRLETNNRLSISGIYCITNLETGEKYIGKSVDIIKRLGQHLETTSKGYDMSLIHKAIRTYGSDAFTFNVLSYCSIEDLGYWERYYIIELQTLSWQGGYNVTLPDISGKEAIDTLTKDEKDIMDYLLTTPLSYSQIAAIVDVDEETVIAINEGIGVTIEGYCYPLRKLMPQYARQKAKWQGIKIFFSEKEIARINYMPTEYEKILSNKSATHNDYLYWKAWWAA